MQPEDVLKELDGGAARPIYLLHGTEHFHVQTLLAALRRHTLQGCDPGLCLSEYDGRTAAVAQVLDDLRTMTFFGGQRLVIVDQADSFLTDNNEVLAKYAKSPSRTGRLVLVCEERPDTRRAAVKAIEAAGALVACEPPKAYLVPAWIRGRARELGKTVTPQGAAALADIVGVDLAQLDSHLRMLIVYVGGRATITDDDVVRTVEQEKVTQIWDLMDGVADKKPKAALEALDRLLIRSGMESIMLGRIATTLLRLKSVKRMLRRLGSEGQVMQALKVHPYVAKKTVAQARKFSLGELDAGLKKALEADRAIKTGRMKPQLAVEKLIIELCT